MKQTGLNPQPVPINQVDCDAAENGVSLTCGDSNGRQDATSPSSGDSQDDCG